MPRTTLIVALFAACLSFSAPAQILYSESFSIVTDSTKVLVGQVQPDLNIRTQRRLLVEFENRADLSVRLGRNAFTFANKLEVARFGAEMLLSGGYLYGEYRRIGERELLRNEFFAQVQWADARGLERKVAGGYHTRLRLLHEGENRLFVGVGPFVERERWSYRGIENDERPAAPPPDARTDIKYSAYVSTKLAPAERVALDLSTYFQNRFDAPVGRGRLALSLQGGYRFTKYLSGIVLYQNLYDPRPVVPIDEWYHRFDVGVNVNF